jgi:hypothetical protein
MPQDTGTTPGQSYLDAESDYSFSVTHATPQLITTPGLFGSPIGAQSTVEHDDEWKQVRWSALVAGGRVALKLGDMGEASQYEVTIMRDEVVLSQYEGQPGSTTTDISTGLAAEAYFDLGKAQSSLGDTAGAKQAFLKAEAITGSPYASRAKNALSQLEP